MAIRIGHASIDENKKSSGGKVGDQTGKEVCIRNWYSKPWEVLLVCTDKAMANRAASYMEQICANPNFGYDQSQRLTGYNSIKANGKKVAGAKGEFDCSSLVACCYILAGLNISPSLRTATLEKALLATGKFKAYKTNARLTNAEYAVRGALYNKSYGHVVMALDTGSKADYYATSNSSSGANLSAQNAESKEEYNMPTIKFGSKGKAVKIWQIIVGVEADGEFGNDTKTATKNFQAKNKLETDGVVGPKSWKAGLESV